MWVARSQATVTGHTVKGLQPLKFLASYEAALRLRWLLHNNRLSSVMTPFLIDNENE
jgi:hypothetical protein